MTRLRPSKEIQPDALCLGKRGEAEGINLLALRNARVRVGDAA